MSAYGRLQSAEERLNNLEQAASALADAVFYLRQAEKDAMANSVDEHLTTTNTLEERLQNELPQLREDAEREHEAEMRCQMMEYKEGL